MLDPILIPLCNAQMRSLAAERCKRTIIVYNARDVTDGTSSWLTYTYLMIYHSVLNSGCDELTGMPFGIVGRRGYRGSMGHGRHGFNMFSGFNNSNPPSFNDHFDPIRSNIQLEGWNPNAAKSNASYAELVAELTRLMEAALAVAKGLTDQAGFESLSSKALAGISLVSR